MEFGGGVGGPARNRSPFGAIGAMPSATKAAKIANAVCDARSAGASVTQPTGDTHGAACACWQVETGALVTTSAARGALEDASGHSIGARPVANNGAAGGKPNAVNIAMATSRRDARRSEVLIRCYTTRPVCLPS